MNGDQYYGDEQAMYTMNRAAYGDVPAALISGGGQRPAGAMYGLHNMMGDIGSRVMPLTYSPPARFIGGQYGEYNFNTSFMKSVGVATGVIGVPRGAMGADYTHSAAGDVGERVGTGLAGAAAALATIPMMSMLSPMTSLVGKSVGAAVGSGLGGLLGAGGAMAGGGIGGAIGGFAGGVVAPYMLAATAAGAVTDAVGERRAIQSFLDQTSHRWVGAGSMMADPRKGGGVSPKAGREISEFIRELDVKDKMVDTGDLTNILRHGTQMGLFTGTRDMEDFKKRFKDITESVKTVTKLLHTTLEDGMKTIADLKAVGIDPSRAREVASQAASLGATAGRTAQEMVGLGLQGAEMFRGTGVQMGIGFQAAQMNVSAIRASRDAGLLSQEAVVQAGGEEALAMKMTAGGLAFSQSTQGRGFAAAFFQPGTGLNQAAFMQNALTGGGNFIQNVQNAAQNLSNPAKLIEFQANQEQIISDMGKKFGGRGLEMAMLGSTASYAEYMAGVTGASREDAFKLALKQQGKSAAEIEAYTAQIKDPDKMFKAIQAGTEATMNKRKFDEASENMLFNRMSAQVGDFVKKEFSDPIARPINEMIDNMKEGVRNFTEEKIYGVERYSAKDIDLSVDFKTEAAREGKGTALDLTGSTPLARSAGEQLISAMTPEVQAAIGVKLKRTTEPEKLTQDQVLLKTDSFSFMNEGLRKDLGAGLEKTEQLNTLAASGVAVGAIAGFGVPGAVLGGAAGALADKALGALGRSLGEPGVVYMDVADKEKALKGLRLLSTTQAEADRMDKAGQLKDVKGKTLVEAFAEGKAANMTDLASASQVLLGKAAPETREEQAYLMTQLKDTQLGKKLEDVGDKAREGLAAIDNVSFAAVKKGVDEFKFGQDQIERAMGAKLQKDVAIKLAQAYEAGKIIHDKDGKVVQNMDLDKQKKLLAEAAAMQARSGGVDFATAEKQIAKGFEGGEIGIQSVIKGQTAVKRAQIAVGTSMLSTAVEEELRGEAGDKIKKEDREKISLAAARLGTGRLADVKEIIADKEILSALKQTDAGKVIAAKAENIADLQDNLKSGLDRADARKVLGKVFTNKEELNKMVDMYEKGSGPRDIIDKAMQSFKDFAPETGVIAAGKASTAAGSDSKTAFQDAAVQTAMNAQTLMAMEALARKLNVK